MTDKLRLSGHGRFGALLLAVALVASACAGSQAAPPKAADDAVSANACEEFARKLCGELGERTEACAGAASVIALLPPRACAAATAEFATTSGRIAELRKACRSVADHVCKELGAESDSCQAITQNLPDIPPGHCMVLARDEERLIAQLREREALTAPLSDTDWQGLLEGTPPTSGAAGARVVVVEFTDFQCPYCAQAADTVRRLREEFASDVRIVLRQFPLPFHADAKGAARAALAAADLGKFWQYHDTLFANQSALGADALVGYAVKAGLSKAAFQTALAAESTGRRVERDIELGTRVHVQGTPTMFINKRRVANPIDYDSVKKHVEAALAAPSQAPSAPAR